jgi:hypothetical protein
VPATLYLLRVSRPALAARCMLEYKGVEHRAVDSDPGRLAAQHGTLGDVAPYVEDHPAIRWAATVVPPLPGPVPTVLPRE